MFDKIGLISYTINFVGFFVLIILLAISWKRQLIGAYLLVAVIFETFWSVVLAYHSYSEGISVSWLYSIEIIRFCTWALLLLMMLRMGVVTTLYHRSFKMIYLLVVVALIYSFVSPLLHEFEIILFHSKTFFMSALLFSVLCIVLTEQIYRNSSLEKRWKIKYLCVGVGAIFAYDLYLYSDALLFGKLNQALWDARGIVNALVVPMLAITVSRNPKLSFDLFISRQAVFYFSGILAIGMYLLLMSIGGYYIRIYGGSWGVVAQIGFLFGALVVLIVILMSGNMRAKIKLFLSKHFYKNKYDYREEWMMLIHNLAEYNSPFNFKEKILQTVARLIQCRGGILFLESDGIYECDSAWNANIINDKMKASDPLIKYVNNRESVIDLHEYNLNKDAYPGLTVPKRIEEIPNAWLVVPLKHHYRLIGFIVLLESPLQDSITWEDSDLLKAVGRQISSYLAFINASAELAEAQQFSTFNRLSAYLVHDLKNQVSQLELITKNAAKHSNDKEFINDAFLTVENVAMKMKKMLSQLKKFQFTTADNKVVNVNKLLEEIVEKRATQPQQPTATYINNNHTCYVNVEPERLENILEHLIQNAQDATKEDGEVSVSLFQDESFTTIKIEDTGIGMDKQFIKERLFRPFDTTKGNAGMGIGVFEAKEFVKYYGGNIEVESTPGKGTTFLIKLPNAYEVTV